MGLLTTFFKISINNCNFSNSFRTLDLDLRYSDKVWGWSDKSSRKCQKWTNWRSRVKLQNSCQFWAPVRNLRWKLPYEKNYHVTWFMSLREFWNFRNSWNLGNFGIFEWQFWRNGEKYWQFFSWFLVRLMSSTLDGRALKGLTAKFFSISWSFSKFTTKSTLGKNFMSLRQFLNFRYQTCMVPNYTNTNYANTKKSKSVDPWILL